MPKDNGDTQRCQRTGRTYRGGRVPTGRSNKDQDDDPQGMKEATSQSARLRSSAGCSAISHGRRSG